MKRKKSNPFDSKKPNFILCDMGLQSAFIHMCQNFQKQTVLNKNDPQDWVIIDNDTGEIVTPFSNNNTEN